MPRKTRTARRASADAGIVQEREDEVKTDGKDVEGAEDTTTMAMAMAPRSVAKGKGKGKGKGKSTSRVEETEDRNGAAVTEPAKEASSSSIVTPPVEEPVASTSSPGPSISSPKLTMAERREKMSALRKQLSQSATANLRDLHLDKTSTKAGPPRDATNSRKLAKAAKVLDQRDAEEGGQDWERVKNWKYTIEDGEKWEEQLERREERKDKGIIDPNGLAERSYRRQVRAMKPDVGTYKAQRGAAESSATGAAGSSSAVALRNGIGNGGQLVKAANDAAALSYGSHRPDESSIDRVVSHLNMELASARNRSRKRPPPDGDSADGSATAINDKNAHYNRKVERFFGEVTRETRENFERGTAL